MTVEQKPGRSICIHHPYEALTALKAKARINLLGGGAGTSRVFRTAPEMLAEEGLSIPEITAELVQSKPGKKSAIISEASQMEDSTL